MISIAITGLDGSGKSTQVELLKNNLLKKNKRVAVTSIWDGLVPFFQGGLHRLSLADCLKSLTPDGRASLMMSSLLEAEKKSQNLQVDYLLWDAHKYKYSATEIILGADTQIINFFSQQIKDPTVCFSLHLTPEKSFARKTLDKVTSYECGLKEINKNNFISFQEKTHSVFAKILPIDTIFINADLSQIEITSQIMEQINCL